jgi:hypothetical protein
MRIPTRLTSTIVTLTEISPQPGILTVGIPPTRCAGEPIRQCAPSDYKSGVWSILCDKKDL